MSDEPKPPTVTREGDPLAGLWTWRDHPLARAGFVLLALLGILLLFPLLAQWTF
jgi:hypothetical protein